MGLSDKIKPGVTRFEEEIRKEVEQEVVNEQPKNLKTSVELSKDEITREWQSLLNLSLRVEIELTYNLVQVTKHLQKLLGQ